jgi:hypothetical protein
MQKSAVVSNDRALTVGTKCRSSRRAISQGIIFGKPGCRVPDLQVAIRVCCDQELSIGRELGNETNATMAWSLENTERSFEKVCLA